MAFVSESNVPTEVGDFLFSVFDGSDGREIIVLSVKRHAEWTGPVLVRVQDQCMTSEVFRSKKCDCRLQLYEAMEQVQRSG